MTPKERARLLSEMEGTFKSRDGIGRLADLTWRQWVDPLDYEEGRLAIRVMVERGQVWLPTPAEFVEAHRTLRQVESPPWQEAWPVIRNALASGVESKRVVAGVAVALGEGAARFVQRYGVERLRRQPTEGERGGAIVAKLGESYAESCEAAREDGAVGRALEFAQREGLAAGRDLRRLDPGPLRGLGSGGYPAQEA